MASGCISLYVRALAHRDLFKSTDFGGELSGGKSGWGSENKVPLVADLSLDDDYLTRWN